jgi:hypothetical protein
MPHAHSFSFVATSRNDDHGGDVLRRTQSFVHRLAEQCTRHQVPSELVLVDWNPPHSRAPLAEVLGWPAGSAWFSARVVTVPSSLHYTLKYSKRLAMFQMIAKNVGIRRVLGDYVIATNIDIIFSDELFQWLKSGDMREGVLYRSDRWDIPNEIQLEPNLDILLARARREAIRHNLKAGTYIRRDDTFVNISAPRFDGTFFQPLEGLIAALKGSLAGDDPVPRDKVLLALDAILLTDLPRLRREFLIPTLHTNACGDFTMMAQRDWFALHGYPEWNIFSWHIDSIMIYQAHFNGWPIEELGSAAVHYHIEHDYGSGWTPEGAGSLWSRLMERGIPFLSYHQFNERVFEMQENAASARFTVYNGPDWGFDSHELECRTMVEEGSPRHAPTRVNEAALDEDFLPLLVAALPGIPLEAVEVVADDITAERRMDENGVCAIAVETRPEAWSYALESDLSQLLPDPHGEYWIRIRIAVDSGNVGLGVLNRDGLDFLTETTCTEEGTHNILIYVKEMGDASRLILRNITPDNRPARFTIEAVQLLHEDRSEAETPLDQADAAVNGVVEKLSAPHERDGGAAAFGRAAPRLAHFRPGVPDAIVRILPAVPGSVEGADADYQTMIILPAGAKETTAVLDLDPPTQAARKIAVHLHVLEGEAVIALQARISGELLVERREAPGPPLTRIDLEAPRTEEIGALVIKNVSASGATKLLLHRVEYQGHPSF